MLNFTKVGFWTEERAAECKRLWASGSTGAQIARKLGTTRSAIMGVIARRGFKAPVTKAYTGGGQHLGKKPPEAPEKPAGETLVICGTYGRLVPAINPWASASPSEVAERSFAATGPKPLMKLGYAECHFPLGNGPFVYCAAPVALGRDYCSDHFRIMYRAR